MPQNLMLEENFGDLLDSRIRKIFDTEYEENVQESMIPMLFGMQSSNRSYEIVSGVGGLGDLQDFDGQISYDSVSQLYDKTFTFPEKALGIKVERKLYDDDLFGVIDQRPRSMALSSARTREKTAAAMWNRAFVGTDGPDSLSLCNSSHPLGPDNATTWDNSGTSALSPTSVEATRRIGMQSILNDRGELLSVNYDTILCSVYNEEIAYEIINSTGKVDTADNNPNFHKGRYKLAVWPRLTSPNNWFMIDSRLAKMFILWWDRVKDGVKMDRDTDSLVAKWYVYERYTCGWADARPVYGHTVS